MTTAPAAIPAADPVAVRARALVDKLWNDGKLGPEIRAKAKELFPDINIPEDQVAPVIAPIMEENKVLKESLDALTKRLDAKERQEAEAAQTVSMEKSLEEARRKFNLTDEGFSKMVERMKAKQNFTDAESAAAWVASQEPVSAPKSGPSWQPQDLNLFGSKTASDDYKLLHKDPEAFFDQTVMQILNEQAAA